MPEQQVQIKITDDVLKGSYANLAFVAHTKEEFILDFASVSPNQGQGMVTAKVFLSPGHTKRLLAVLAENVKKYEQQFGAITEAQTPSVEPEIGFQSKEY